MLLEEYFNSGDMHEAAVSLQVNKQREAPNFYSGIVSQDATLPDLWRAIAREPAIVGWLLA